jgi:hypothetical protein
MEKLEVRLQRRMHVSLYALLFLTILLGISILLEGCSQSAEKRADIFYRATKMNEVEQIQSEKTMSDENSLSMLNKIQEGSGRRSKTKP